MTNAVQSFIKTIKRKLGYPEVSILILGDDNSATRNRTLVLKAHADLDTYILDDSLVELPAPETFSFHSNHFLPFESMLYFIDATKEEMIKHERNFFWEQICWNETTKSLPIAICAYNSHIQGSLSRAELIENLSLIRLSDHLWELFETGETQDSNGLLTALNWLKKVIRMGYLKSWEIKEELIESLGPRKVDLIIDDEDNN